MNLKNKRICGFLLVFLISFSVCILVTCAYVQNKCKLEYLEMEHLAMTKTSKINSVISKLLYKTQGLAALVIQNDGDIYDFERVAATIMDDPAIKNLILAPNGIVSHIYPLEGNEKAMGLNYFSEGAGNKEAIAARDSGQLVLGGPFELVQGDQALVGRLPVYLNRGDKSEFWGLVSVTLKFPEALNEAELDQLKNQGFAYEIWRISPDTNQRQMITNSNYSYNESANFVEQKMSILNATWYFRLSPIKNWYEHPETWIYSIVGFFISVLMAFLVIHNSDLRRLRLELEEITYHDALTGILNRRGMFHILNEIITRKDCEFLLCYMDLDRFKEINDTFGHNVGDKVLQSFTYEVQKQMKEQHIFARIGGDEFVFVFKDTTNKTEAVQFFQKVKQELRSTAVVAHTKDLPINFSVGVAVFPIDGESIDDLIGFADNEMYKEKVKVQVQ